MIWMAAYPMIAAAYGFLFLSMLLLWFPGRRPFPRWGYSFLIAVFCGLWSNQIETTSVIAILIFAVAVYYSQVKKIAGGLRIITNAVVLFLATGFAIHQMPGFDGWPILNHLFLTPDALPYSLYFSFDKVMIGLFILGLGFPLMHSRKEFVQMFKKTWRLLVALIVVMMLLASIMGYVRFEFKLPACIVVWALSNLFFTCLSEEALFRGFIQKKLVLLFGRKKGGAYIGIILAAILFGLAHYGGGSKYVFLATVAGLGYGWAYQVTGRIEAAIMTHFGVNLFHFIFFTYPALAKAFQ